MESAKRSTWNTPGRREARDVGRTRQLSGSLVLPDSFLWLWTHEWSPCMASLQLFDSVPRGTFLRPCKAHAQPTGVQVHPAGKLCSTVVHISGIRLNVRILRVMLSGYHFWLS